MFINLCIPSLLLRSIGSIAIIIIMILIFYLTIIDER